VQENDKQRKVPAVMKHHKPDLWPPKILVACKSFKKSSVQELQNVLGA